MSEDPYIIPHFRRSELVCSCGCGGLPEQCFLDALHELRVAYGDPMILNSAYRCPDYNAQVSSTGRDGPHTIGAVDVRLNGRDAHRLLAVALELGWTGIGIKQHGAHAGRFIHLDFLTYPKPRPWVWSYD